MGIVINFPAVERTGSGPRTRVEKSEPAAIVILPVVRIERYGGPTGDMEPDAGNPSRRRRRRPATRS
jgi:hypothetical protein